MIYNQKEACPMPSTNESVETLAKRRDELKARLNQIRDMRPGSLWPRFRKCGKPTCHCAKEGSPSHGPVWTLTWKAKGKTVARIIPEGPATERTREQIAEFRQFQEITQELVEVSGLLCDAKLAEPEAEAEAKKGASNGNLTRRSLRNPKPS
jgi:hypothetical protein